MQPLSPWTTTHGIWHPLEYFDRDRLPIESFSTLLELARETKAQAYAPYSQFRVGSAVQMGDMAFSGCNVENASYGATTCAERSAIFQGIKNGRREISIIAISTDADSSGSPESRSPCGMCRQVISEFAIPTAVVLLDRGNSEDGRLSADIISFNSLLPLRFQIEKRD